MHAQLAEALRIVLNAAAFALLSTRARVYLLLAWSATLRECEVSPSFFTLALSLPFYPPAAARCSSSLLTSRYLSSYFEERARGRPCALLAQR